MRSYLIKLENSDMSKFKVSMEDDAGMLNPEIVAAIVEIPKTQVDVAVAASDIAMRSSDVSNCVSDIETGQTDIATLSDIQDVLVEASTKVEGIDETTAAVTQIAVEAIYARLGLVVKPIPAMETFASKHSRKVATNVAIEGIGDSIKRIWEAILNALKKVWEKIQGFVKSLFIGKEHLEKRVKELKQKVESIDSSKISKTDKPLDKPIKALRANGKSDVITAASFIISVECAIEAAKKLSEYNVKLSQKNFEIEESEQTLLPNDAISKILNSAFNFAERTDTGSYIAYGKFNHTKHFRLYLTHIALVIPGDELPEIEQTEVIPFTSIKPVLKDVEKSLKALNEFNNLFKEQESVNKKAQDAVRDFISNQSKTDKAELVKIILKTSITVIDTVPGLVIETLKTIVDYAAASVDHYEKESKSS